ncbi:acyltransferase family protein, partial [Turicimonas muris]
MSQLSQKFKKDNKDFMVLSAVCILFVVDAHAGGPINLLNKIFPYDSFFMPAFIFISGYFYKVPITSNETKRFCLKKLKRLLVPYYLYNILISLLWLIPIFFVTQQLWG